MAPNELVEKALALALEAGRRPDRGSHEWWVCQWRDLAKVSHPLLQSDPRTSQVLAGLGECDRAYKAKNLDEFERAAKHVQRLMRLVPGVMIEWARTDRTRQSGRVDLRQSDSDGILWVFVTLPDGSWSAVNLRIVTVETK